MSGIRDLIHRYFDDSLDETGVAELDARLAADPEARALFVEMARDQSLLMETLRGDADLLLSDVEQPPSPRVQTERFAVTASRRRITAIRQRAPEPAPGGSILPWAAAILIGLLLAYWLSTGSSRQRPAPAVAHRKPAPAAPSEVKPAPQTPAPDRAPKPPAVDTPILPDSKPAVVAPRPVRIAPKPDDSARPPVVPPPAPPAPRIDDAPPTPALPTVPADEGTAIATLDKIEGEVFLLVGSERRPARADQPFLPGNGLLTDGRKSHAELRLPDGTHLMLDAKTEIRDRTARGAAGDHLGRLALERGTLRARVASRPDDRPLVFSTPHADALVLGTRLVLAVTADATRLDVTEGRVRLTRRSDGASVELSAGQYAVATPGKPFRAADLIRIQSFQDGVSPAASYKGTRDTTIARIAEPVPAGARKTCRVNGRSTRGASRETCVLLRWDLSAIPPGSTVVSATLQLHVEEGAAKRPFRIFPLMRPWNEAKATWLVATPILPWDRRGADGPADRGKGVLASPPDGVGQGALTLGFTKAGVAVVQDWVNRPSANFGIVLANNQNAEGATFCTREHGTAKRRPKLTVAFIPSGQEKR